MDGRAGMRVFVKTNGGDECVERCAAKAEGM